jgi:hypothetical protein
MRSRGAMKARRNDLLAKQSTHTTVPRSPLRGTVDQ